MRLRAITTAAACSLALVVATSGSASAEALGKFHYTYTDAQGTEQRTWMEGDPGIETNACLDVPGAADATKTDPAHSPDNQTDKTVWVFEERDCQGTKYTLGEDGKGGVNLKFRSVYFDQDS
ncbi:hypothetical protein ABT390_16595 [Streptomyces aurantiacus]|uniref:Uncharacterized protein n=1 Tax=Streptomyces aurantiacus JA 4570 TaxID=1286094 RepID=S3Z932_9ACTN|nr:hypothetical protein [Streptomyces aurantiacus]EPH40221.1 hypothetical protein STRAU_6715 [Streptomyces aurantiacus JA 4570]